MISPAAGEAFDGRSDDALCVSPRGGVGRIQRGDGGGLGAVCESGASANRQACRRGDELYLERFAERASDAGWQR